MDAKCFILFYFVGVIGADTERTATCEISSTSGVHPVHGVITFTQQMGSNVTIDVCLSGFNTSQQKHGIHVHEHGDLANSCDNAGGHYNPENLDHGGPTDVIRHLGDLGNLVTINGKVETTISDHLVTLFGDYSVMGRSIVVHEREDDLGRGNSPESLTTGDSGGRWGCCVITLIRWQ